MELPVKSLQRNQRAHFPATQLLSWKRALPAQGPVCPAWLHPPAELGPPNPPSLQPGNALGVPHGVCSTREPRRGSCRGLWGTGTHRTARAWRRLARGTVARPACRHSSRPCCGQWQGCGQSSLATPGKGATASSRASRSRVHMGRVTRSMARQDWLQSPGTQS